MPIAANTVLILGAGASQPYGFPLGVGLRDAICQRLTAIDYSHVMQQLGFDRTATASFLDDLQHSGFASVDAFLEANPNYLSIGKAAIATVLLPYEHQKHLFPPHVSSANHWYEYLVNQMDVGVPRWNENRLTVLTFNYDRSFEHYFIEVIQRRAGASAPEAASLFKHVTLVHLHGQLGNYPLLGSDPVAYGEPLTPGSVMRAAAAIRVVSEAGDDLSTFRTARDCLLGAQRVYFLGFGFAEVSVRRLEVFTAKEYETWAPVVLGGTSKGIPDRNWRYLIRELFRDRWNGTRWRRSVAEFVRSEANFY